MEISTFQRNVYYNTLIDQVSSLCNELVRQECKFSLSVKLEHFQFSLSSEKQVPARGTGKRPPSYMRRQIRRRENFLQRNSGFPPAKEETEGDDKTSHMQEEGDLLDKKVPSPGQTTGDEIDNNISLDLTPHMASPPVRSPRRQLPPSGCDAKPLHSDRKHIVDTSGFKNATYQKKNVTVFAPGEISREEIIKAMHPVYDGRYLRQTSWKMCIIQHLAMTRSWLMGTFESREWVKMKVV